MKRQLNGANDKLLRLQRHQEMKVETNQEKIDKLKKDHESVSTERAQAMAKVEENEKICETMEEKVILPLIIDV